VGGVTPVKASLLGANTVKGPSLVRVGPRLALTAKLVRVEKPLLDNTSTTVEGEAGVPSLLHPVNTIAKNVNPSSVTLVVLFNNFIGIAFLFKYLNALLEQMFFNSFSQTSK
jgi:hypothetical protein